MVIPQDHPAAGKARNWFDCPQKRTNEHRAVDDVFLRRVRRVQHRFDVFESAACFVLDSPSTQCFVLLRHVLNADRASDVDNAVGFHGVCVERTDDRRQRTQTKQERTSTRMSV